MIAGGYEDGNDAASFAHDPLQDRRWSVLPKAPPRGPVFSAHDLRHEKSAVYVRYRDELKWSGSKLPRQFPLAPGQIVLDID